MNAGFSLISKLGHHAEWHKLFQSFGKRQEVNIPDPQTNHVHMKINFCSPAPSFQPPTWLIKVFFLKKKKKENGKEYLYST